MIVHTRTHTHTQTQYRLEMADKYYTLENLELQKQWRHFEESDIAYFHMFIDLFQNTSRLPYDRYSMIYGVDDEELYTKLTTNEAITRAEFIECLKENDRSVVQEELPDGTLVRGDNTGTMLFIMEDMDVGKMNDDVKTRIMGLFPDLEFNSTYDGFLSFVIPFPPVLQSKL